jgi:hypothetical protein
MFDHYDEQLEIFSKEVENKTIEQLENLLVELKNKYNSILDEIPTLTNTSIMMCMDEYRVVENFIKDKKELEEKRILVLEQQQAKRQKRI